MIGAGIVPAARSSLDQISEHMPRGNMPWVCDKLADLDTYRQKRMAERYRDEVKRAADQARYGQHTGSLVAKANRALANYHEELVRHDLVLTGSDRDLKAWSRVRASECQDITGNESGDRALRMVTAVADRYGIALPTLKETRGEYCPIFARATSARWWLRKVRRLQALALERFARLRQIVSRDGDLYLSDGSMKRRQRQLERNRRALQLMEAVNDDGEAYTLADLSGRSIANPEIRRIELMVRMRGFKEVAQRRGHVGEFITFTSPSQYHAMKAPKKGRVVVNKKWVRANQPDVLDGQQWLCKRWELIRSAMHRRGIRTYGFRIAEPHHDGTVHWHMVLFFHPDEVAQAREIMWHYMMADSPTESGAVDHRVTFKSCDPAKGDAVSYIAKYVAKNIDGFALDGESTDESDLVSGADGAARTVAWATTWGIRQFQQIGGPGVTVWRELRRLHGEVTQPDLFEGTYRVEQAVQAADAGSWADYVEAMGGPNLPRAARPIRPAYWLETKASPVTGNAIPARDTTEYGEPSKGAVFGVWVVRIGDYGAEEVPMLTRERQWFLRPVPIGSPPPVAGPPGFRAAA